MKRILFSMFLILGLTGCAFKLETVRSELVPSPAHVKRVYVSIDDAGLGAGTQAYVNASLFAAVKQGTPAATLVNGGEDLAIKVNMLAPVFQPRWFTLLTLGLLKEYYQLGSVRVVHATTGKILSIHTLTVTGKRVFPVELVDYQKVIIPQLITLIRAELKTNGLAGNRPLEIVIPEA